MTEFSIKEALVCIDLSDTDTSLMDYLNYMHTKLKIRNLYFLHVVKRPTFLSGILGRNIAAIHSEFVLNEDINKQICHNIVSKLLQFDDSHIECEVLEGNPLDRILEESKEHHADLLVLGKKQGTTSAGILAKSLARLSPASLLIVPQKNNKRLEHIIVPVDFSESSGKALQKAIQLNYQLEHPAIITCVHVFEMPDLSYYKINKTYEQLREIIEMDLLEAFGNFLEKYAPNMGDMLHKKSVLRSEISTAGQLIIICDELGADMVIMGAKGHSILNNLFIGSVAEKFIQMNDKNPILLIK